MSGPACSKPCLAALLASALVGGCAPRSPAGETGFNVRGWTGTTHVVGNNSSVADNAEATYQQQKWPYLRP